MRIPRSKLKHGEGLGSFRPRMGLRALSLVSSDGPVSVLLGYHQPELKSYFGRLALVFGQPGLWEMGG